ncbi:MAG: DUF2062 domain-containing protein [Leptolyngbyaceae cyanobacterium bins.59]|nr:DUF2062 domain-containing protein [Leptolyngbyaceae cyanobacterium bins.59]
MKRRRTKSSLIAQGKRISRYLYLRFIRLRGNPVEISRGFAVGIFWGMFPLPGLQMATAALTAAIVRGNILAAAAGTWLTNPLTTLPIAALNLHVGQRVLGRSWEDLPQGSLTSWEGFFSVGWEMIGSFLLGCLITGTIAGITSYFVAIPVIESLKHRAAQRKLHRQQVRQKKLS